MTKEELIEAIKDYPEDAEVMTSPGDNTRWDIFEVFYDKDLNTIVVV